MRSEFLSDGQLFESETEWKKAFADHPQGSAKAIWELQRSFSAKLATSAFDPHPIHDLFSLCQNELTRLLSLLPSNETLFPKDDEKQALLSLVCRFLARMEEIAPTLWKCLENLSLNRETLGSLLEEGQRLRASLLVAANASKGMMLSPDPSRTQKDFMNDFHALLCAWDRTRDLQANLEELYLFFFRDFTNELSHAADLEHDGAAASPAKVLTACGYAKQALCALTDRTRKASLPGSPDAKEKALRD